MESYSEVFRQAKDRLKIADYSIGRIFQLSRDPNVVRSAMTNLHEAQIRALDSLLLFERGFKRVPAYPTGHLETKLRLFSEYCAKRYDLDENIVKDFRMLHEWVQGASGKPISVSADSRLIISDGGFQTTAVPIPAIKKMILKTNSFIESVGKVVQDAGGN